MTNKITHLYDDQKRNYDTVLKLFERAGYSPIWSANNTIVY